MFLRACVGKGTSPRAVPTTKPLFHTRDVGGGMCAVHIYEVAQSRNRITPARRPMRFRDIVDVNSRDSTGVHIYKNARRPGRKTPARRPMRYRNPVDVNSPGASGSSHLQIAPPIRPRAIRRRGDAASQTGHENRDRQFLTLLNISEKRRYGPFSHKSCLPTGHGGTVPYGLVGAILSLVQHNP